METQSGHARPVDDAARAMTDEDVVEARRMARKGASTAALAEHFNVGIATMRTELFGYRPRQIDGVEPPVSNLEPRKNIALGVRSRILSYITRYVARNGLAPSIREIAAACGISSTSVVAYHLKRLERDGVIARRGRIPRGMTVVEEAMPGAKGVGRYVLPGETVQVDVDGLVLHGAFVA